MPHAGLLQAGWRCVHIVMSLYPKSAAKRLKECQGALGLEEVIAIAKDVLEGLAQLHALHILHLDLKPGNILLDDCDHAYLSNFGISHALRTLETCTAVTSRTGTPHYMCVHSLTSSRYLFRPSVVIMTPFVLEHQSKGIALQLPASMVNIATDSPDDLWYFVAYT